LRNDLSYFPKYPWYWDGVELFNGISIHPKPLYHPNYLSITWKPKRKEIDNSSSLISSTSPLRNKDSPTRSASINDEKNKKNFTLSLTRTNSF